MMRTRMAVSVALLLAVLCIVGVQAYDNQQSWLDGSMDADSAMQMLERDTDRPFAQQQAPQQQAHAMAPIAEFDEAAAAPVALMEVAATTHAKAATQAQAQMRTSHGWVNGPPRRERVTGRRGALSRERSQLRLQAAQDAQYAENLRRFAARREHFRVPASIPAVIERHRSALAGETAEESAVESLIQLTEQKPVVLHHSNDIHAKLTADQLFGRGLAVEANRRKTAWALANSPRNRPQAPAFQSLPPVASAASQRAAPQPKEMSFVQTKESRPFVLGPATAALPAKEAKPVAAARKVASVVPAEHEFVAGLPQAFMELDAATQVQILALADQELQAEAKQQKHPKQQLKQTQQHAQSHTLKSKSKSRGASKHTALLQTRSETTENINEAELASAGEALHALSAIHAATHTPWAKLLKALAGAANK